jgi:putative ABC transport system permease protein
MLLQGIVILVLVLCCFNLTSVQFSRAQARQHEFAVRAALGAGGGGSYSSLSSNRCCWR